jgi:hypothetical protein
MGIAKKLDVPYHPQGTNTHCGPACAQMVLDHRHLAVPTQPDMYADECHTTGDLEYWASNPDGLATTLEERTGGGSFTAHKLDSEVAISRRLVWMIHEQGRPAIALINGWTHWVLVAGSVVSQAPTSPVDPLPTIDCFEIHDPYPVGTGVAATAHQYEQVHYADWQANYLLPVPILFFEGKYIAVCDPDPPGLTGAHAIEAQPERENEPDQDIGGESAVQAALEALDRESLANRDPWVNAREGTVPGAPILVNRLSPASGRTYLVPFIRQLDPEGPASIPLIVRVNAASGTYQGAIAFLGGSAKLGQMLDQESIIERYTSGNGVPDPDGNVIYPKREDLKEDFYWRPCGESPSVYLPFYLFDVGGVQLFVSLDDKDRYFKLTDVFGA